MGTEIVESCTESADHGVHVERCSKTADHGVHVENYTETADQGVLNVKPPREQNKIRREKEMGEKKKAEKILGDGVVAYALVERADRADEMGGTEMLDIQPLAIMGIGGIQSVSPDWVLERVLEFCRELGLICNGHEEDLLALFTAIKANRQNKRGGSGYHRSSKTRNRGNRELKRLEYTVNYEVKESSKVSGKGRASKYY
jgi:hypothetical protein